MRCATLLLLGFFSLCTCATGCQDAFDTSNQPGSTVQDAGTEDAGQDGGGDTDTDTETDTETDTGTDTSVSGG